MNKAPVLARTPLHHWHAAHGVRFQENDGWLLPAAFPAKDVKTPLALADISSWTKVSLHGRGVPALTEALLGVSAASTPCGVACVPGSTGGLACRLAADHLFLLASSSSSVFDERLASLLTSRDVIRWDATTALAGFLLAGPGERLLRRLVSIDVSAAGLPPGSCAETGLAGAHALLARSEADPSPATRIYVAWDLAEYVWERLLEAGREEGIRAVGLDELPALQVSVRESAAS